MENNSLKYTTIFGGGAIRGVAYIGAIKAMEELGVQSNTLVGSSVGSVIAGFMSVGYSAEELEDIFMNVNFDMFRDIHFGFKSGIALSKGEVYLEFLREMIEKKYYGKDYQKGQNAAVTFKDIDKNLVIITTDLTNFKCKEFSKFETPDFEVATAIRISSSMPGLMTTMKYNNIELVDGDLQKSWPLWKLSDNISNSKDRILEFRLEGDRYAGEKTPVDYINTVYSCITAIATGFVVDSYAHKDKFDYIVLNTGNIVFFDFNQSMEKRKELINMGYTQTVDYFKNCLPNKKKSLIEDYQSISQALKKIKNYLSKNDIQNAKIELGMLFADLCELNNSVDTIYYKKLKAIKTKFKEELKPTFLGLYSTDLLNKLKSDISVIANEIDEKIDELNAYITTLSGGNKPPKLFV